MGFVADAECVLDSRLQPLLVDDFCNSFGSRKPTKMLPQGATRLAVIVAGFQVGASNAMSGTGFFIQLEVLISQQSVQVMGSPSLRLKDNLGQLCLYQSLMDVDCG